MDDHQPIVIVAGGSQCGKTAAMEAALFDRDLVRLVDAFATAHPLSFLPTGMDIGSTPGEDVVKIGEVYLTLESLRTQLAEAGIEVTIRDHSAVLVLERINEFWPGWPVLEERDQTPHQSYLAHDPTKNTKRRMRRMKGKKA